MPDRDHGCPDRKQMETTDHPKSDGRAVEIQCTDEGTGWHFPESADGLRQLENDGLVYRKDYGTNPPKVEYGMTELGKELLNVLHTMADFGNYYKSLEAHQN